MSSIDRLGAEPQMIERRLRALRIFVGVMVLVRTTPLLYLVPGLRHNLGGPLIGWPESSSLLRTGLFGIVLPIALVKVCVCARTIAALGFAIGVWRPRITGIATALLGYVVWSQDPFSFIFTLHTLYLATLLIAIGSPRPSKSPVSSLWLIRAFVVSIYGWSGIAKLHGRWLDGTVLRVLRDEMQSVTGPIARTLLASDRGLHITAIAIPAIEILLIALLLHPRSRVVGVALACMLHAGMELTMHPDVFGWLMVGLCASFWPLKDQRSGGTERRRHSPA